jgi:hypothetical protein
MQVDLKNRGVCPTGRLAEAAQGDFAQWAPEIRDPWFAQGGVAASYTGMAPRRKRIAAVGGGNRREPGPNAVRW